MGRTTMGVPDPDDSGNKEGKAKVELENYGEIIAADLLGMDEVGAVWADLW